MNKKSRNMWACTTAVVELSVGIIVSQSLKPFENLALKVKTDIKRMGYLIPSLRCCCVHLHWLAIQGRSASLHNINRINEGTILVLTESSYFFVCIFLLCMSVASILCINILQSNIHLSKRRWIKVLILGSWCTYFIFQVQYVFPTLL